MLFADKCCILQVTVKRGEELVDKKNCQAHKSASFELLAFIFGKTQMFLKKIVVVPMFGHMRALSANLI